MSIDWAKKLKEYEKDRKKISKGDINWEKELRTYEKERYPETYQAKIDEQRAERREAGLPVSVSKKKAEPSMVGGMAREILTPAADIVSNLINAVRPVVGKEPKDVFKTKYFGDIKGLGRADITKSPLSKDNIKVLLKSGYTGAEIASYINLVQTAATAPLRGGSKLLKTASKDTFKEWFKKHSLDLLKEGVAQGALYTTGHQGRESIDTGKKFSAKQAGLDVATIAAMNVLMPSLIRRTFGTKTSKIMDARKAVEGLEKIGSPVKDVPTPKTSPIKQADSLVKKAEKAPFDDIKYEKLPEAKPKETGLPTIDLETGLEVKKPNLTKETSGVIGKTDGVVNKMGKDNIGDFLEKDVETFKKIFNVDGVEPFSEGTFKTWSRELRELGREEIFRVGKGGKKTIETSIPETAYRAIASDILAEDYFKTGKLNMELFNSLEKSPVGSKSGQSFVANKMLNKEDIFKIASDIKEAQYRKAGIEPKKLKIEEEKVVTSLQKKITEASDKKLGIKKIKEIIKDLICK